MTKDEVLQIFRQTGALLEGRISPELDLEWRRASADSFEPNFARELAVARHEAQPAAAG